ncbi:hypothetical protein C7H10_12350 [Marinobacter shengliensis]|nr:hypothetical protein C7H10_12350 [Marinobacter shengliensis]
MKAILVLGKAQENLAKKIKSDSSEPCVVFSVYATDIEGAIIIGRFNFIFNYLSILRGLRKCFTAHFLELYTPHFVNFVANILYFRCKNVRVFYLYDGILNFRSVSWGQYNLKRAIFLNKLKSILYFHRFKKVGKVINDKSIANFKNVIVPSSMREQGFSFDKYTLFVDDDLAVDDYLNYGVAMILEPANYANGDLEVLTKKLKNFCLERSVSRVILKTHPRCKKSLLSNFFRNSFEVESFVGDVDCAENIFVKYRPAYVLGDYSSAMLNIKSLHSSAEIFSYGLIKSEVPTNLEAVIELMKRQGVTFFERT